MGASHYGIGDIFKNNPEVKLRQFYSISKAAAAATDSPDHSKVIRKEGVMHIDVENKNAIDMFRFYIDDIDGSEL